MGRMTVSVALPTHHILGEGPAWSERRQALYLVDIPARQVLRWRPGRPARSWTMPEPVSAAIPRRGGGLVVTLASQVALLDEDDDDTGDHTGNDSRPARLATLARPDPDPGNRANEARCDAAGRLWLGTMQNNIGPDGGDIPITASTGGLFRIDALGATSRHAAGIGIANTLCWAPDGRTLYFADTMRNRIDAHGFDPLAGTLGPPRPFAVGGPGAPDGSAIDADGFLWTARWGASCLLRYAPDGRVDRTVALPASQPTSCAFAGPGSRTLFVTTARTGLDSPGDADGAVLAVDAGIDGPACHEFAG
jgi:sugar lactone lactonase YvrE